MRSKEHAHDYRYLPDPDLLPFHPTDDWISAVRQRLVELPLARKQRFMRDYGLAAGDADVFRDNVPLGSFFEKAALGAGNPRTLGNWIINHLAARLRETGLDVAALKFPPAAMRELAEMVDAGRINSRMAQEVLSEMVATGAGPSAIVDTRGLAQVSDSAAIEALCDQVIAAHPGPVADYRSGRAAALNFLKGQVMKLSKGKANPAAIGATLARKLVAS
jgi:aspartyl-tRNA(Asn)/glutamyl-tRNA(Gln) amidotransferase subunit B